MDLQLELAKHVVGSLDDLLELEYDDDEQAMSTLMSLKHYRNGTLLAPQLKERLWPYVKERILTEATENTAIREKPVWTYLLDLGIVTGCALGGAAVFENTTGGMIGAVVGLGISDIYNYASRHLSISRGELNMAKAQFWRLPDDCWENAFAYAIRLKEDALKHRGYIDAPTSTSS